MDANLERLIQLQELENDLRRVRAELDELPGKKAALEASLEAERAQLDAARATLDESQRNRRQNEGRLQDLETKRSKYKGQLMEVKTNKEYTAMLHEIETVEREISSTEDQILAEMERADELNGRVKSESQTFEEAQKRHRDETARLDERMRALEAEAADLEGRRDVQAEALPEELRELFARVAKLRGVAVSEARDGMCVTCRVKVRPQFYVELKRNDRVRQCDACSRILYYAPPAPEVAPVP